MTAAAARLRYVDDTMPGIRRRRRGRYWQYFDDCGKRITDRAEIERLNAIGMPPAYRRVWLCPDPNGHIQAVGYDARGRRQYRYHPGFRAKRDASKFERLVAFGRRLARLRKRLESDLAGDPTGFETVVAAVVSLIDASFMRIGNEEYARDNKSFGATTLRNRHATVTGHRIEISWPGKHGVKQAVSLTDRRLARVARRTQELPGQHLFEYVAADGKPRAIGSGEVNAYIQEAMGEEFTAKDFRTWGASVIAFEQLARNDGEVRLKAMIEPVAEALGNTPTISRNSYVHPALVAAAQDKAAAGPFELPRATKYLAPAERGLIAFLETAGRGRKAGTSGRR